MQCTCTLPKYAPSVLPLLSIPCIGHSLSSIGFEWKKKRVDFFQFFFALRFISETFFIKGYRVWLLTSVNSISIQSIYGGLDKPYGFNNIKTAKEGSLDV